MDDITTLQAQVSLLTKKLEEVSMIQVPPSACNWCGVPHPSETCLGEAAMKQANAMGNNFQNPQFNPYSNTYNAGWKQHPNLSWGGKQQPHKQSQQQQFQQQQRLQQQQYLQPQQQNAYQIPQQREPSLEETIKAFMKTEAAERKLLLQQIIQLAKQLNERPQRSLPSNTETNPKEHVKSITL